MAAAPACSSVESGLPVQCGLSSRRSRKSGCSNIFTGVHLHQLHRLFRTAGDRDAEHQARLVWNGMNADLMEGAEEDQDLAVLAQALVGLRVRARNKAGVRAEARREHKWLRASGYLRVEEPFCGCTDEVEEDTPPHSPGKCLLSSEEDMAENLNPFKPSSWRFDLPRQECSARSEHYLHRILH